MTMTKPIAATQDTALEKEEGIARDDDQGSAISASPATPTATAPVPVKTGRLSPAARRARSAALWDYVQDDFARKRGSDSIDQYLDDPRKW